MATTMAPVDFRAMTESDLPQLAHWLGAAHVARWWAHDPERTVDEFTAELVDGRTDYFIVTYQQQRIGMLQRYPIAAYPEYVDEFAAAGVPLEPEAWSIDYLIGEATMTGRGLGTAMIATAAARLWIDHPAAQAIVVPVHADNQVSHGALRAASFSTLSGIFDLAPDNPQDDRRHLIHVLRRPGSGTPVADPRQG